MICSDVILSSGKYRWGAVDEGASGFRIGLHRLATPPLPLFSLHIHLSAHFRPIRITEDARITALTDLVANNILCIPLRTSL